MFTFNLERCSTCSVVAHVLLLCTLEGSAYHTIYHYNLIIPFFLDAIGGACLCVRSVALSSGLLK